MNANSKQSLETWARHAAATNGFGGDLPPAVSEMAVSEGVPAAARAWPATREDRSSASTAIVLLKRLRRAWRRWRAARATRLELATLDARTLRDLGIDPSETGSVAAEVFGLAERTRALAMRP
jgi:uncharacterized protein YjiS (DUF1127 family)